MGLGKEMWHVSSDSSPSWQVSLFTRMSVTKGVAVRVGKIGNGKILYRTFIISTLAEKNRVK